MGINYEPVSGFSINLSVKLQAELIEEYGSLEKCFEELNIEYSYIGSSYSDQELESIPIYTPESCVELDWQLEVWLERLSTKLERTFKVKDVVFISEVLVF